ncbi:aspartate 1-decarboxylase [Calderihabitans maritimus]|uniref:Aspartate 1-decarboxylase n=1 Tax=Calderihabitans maritimus TaxID=1246530 RepID=A0A1Z5HUD2_9FIRM|nr:aspartate 1-decarboxylase [Calderihabitans maritimus]GAW92957.1 aspartate alpha-decarboxylase [Calderihabitans maritimus]
MLRCMLKSKIHRAMVTEANLNYVGSITIDSSLLKAADILPGEKVSVVNINNGARFDTYVIAGEEGKGSICVNGAAARLVQPEDLIIIISYAYLSEKELQSFTPKIVLVNQRNKILSVLGEEREKCKFDSFLKT